MSLEHSPACDGGAPGGHPAVDGQDRFIDERECQRLTNLSRVTRWRLIRRGDFPAKIRLSPNRTAWRLSDILDWMQQRVAA